MSQEPIPAELRDFLISTIESIAQLEALLLMRASPEQSWTARSAADRLYVSEREAAEVMRHLVSAGLATQLDGDFLYGPRAPKLAVLVDQLAEHYRHHLIPITKLIHARPLRITEFSDAFKFRKE